MDFREQWEKVDMDFMKQLIKIHNEIVVGEREENDFDKFVLENKEKFNNPDYLQVFAKRIELTDEYFAKHFEMCEFVWKFMRKNPDWKKLDFNLSDYLILGLFEDTFGTYYIFHVKI